MEITINLTELILLWMIVKEMFDFFTSDVKDPTVQGFHAGVSEFTEMFKAPWR